jgi:hypothetical protein
MYQKQNNSDVNKPPDRNMFRLVSLTRILKKDCGVLEAMLALINARVPILIWAPPYPL